jgi:hypothetical protein
MLLFQKINGKFEVIQCDDAAMSFTEKIRELKTTWLKDDNVAEIEQINYQNGDTSMRLKDRTGKIITEYKLTH